jgi:phage-related protein
MGRQDRDKSAKYDATKALFRVRPTRQARRESEAGKGLFQTEREKQWVMRQLRLLYHWPLDRQHQNELGTDLDFSKVSYNNETFYELRLDDEKLHQKNLRLFFWVHDALRTIWIIHGYWKKTQRLDEAVKTLVSRRIKALKGGMQDGSIK